MGSRLFEQVIQVGYYRPTIESNAVSFAQKCQKYQLKLVYIHLGHSILGPLIQLVYQFVISKSDLVPSYNRMLQ